jgi:hypothetical protein
MNVIVSGRRAGKTTRLLLLMADNPNMIYVTFTEEAAETAWKQAQKMGLVSLARHRFTSANAVRTGSLKGLYDPQLVVDNAELVLAALLGQTPHTATMTGTRV